MKTVWIAAAGLMLLVMGCSDSEETASNIVIEGEETTEAEPTSADDEALAFEFAACMRDAGIQMDDPTLNADGSIDLFGGGGPPTDGDQADRELLRSGFEVCRELIEGTSFARERPDIENDVELQDQILGLAQCLRDAGYTDVEDPTFDAFNAGDNAGEQQRGQRGGLFGDSIDFGDEAVVETLDACREEVGIEEGPGAGGQGRGGGQGPDGGNRAGGNGGGQ